MILSNSRNKMNNKIKRNLFLIKLDLSFTLTTAQIFFIHIQRKKTNTCVFNCFFCMMYNLGSNPVRFISSAVGQIIAFCCDFSQIDTKVMISLYRERAKISGCSYFFSVLSIIPALWCIIFS